MDNLKLVLILLALWNLKLSWDLIRTKQITFMTADLLFRICDMIGIAKEKEERK